MLALTGPMVAICVGVVEPVVVGQVDVVPAVQHQAKEDVLIGEWVTLIVAPELPKCMSQVGRVGPAVGLEADRGV